MPVIARRRRSLVGVPLAVLACVVLGTTSAAAAPTATRPATTPSTATAPAATAPVGGAGGSDSSPPPTATVVATALNNPRLLSFSSSGALYVAEAGTGGTGPCVTGPEGRVCLGRSGSVTRLLAGPQRRIVTGLASVAGEGGRSATGPADVEVDRRGRYTILMGLGNDPAARARLGSPGRTLGTLLTGRSGCAGPRVVADVSAHETRANPGGGGLDSNPSSMVRTRRGTVVAEAGGNALLRVRHQGVRTLAAFPTRQVAAPPFLQRPPGTKLAMESVPTSVALGPDGALYVSELTGFPFPRGEARIYRVVAGQRPTVFASGLTNVTDLAWHRGRLYAVQLSDVGLAATPEGSPPVGSLVRVTPGGGAHRAVASGLTAPYGVALKDRSAYVTTCAVCPGGGQVVRIAVR